MIFNKQHSKIESSQQSFYKITSSKIYSMKRKSDIIKHQLPKNFPHNDSEFQYVRRQARRNYTTFRVPDQNTINSINQTFSKNLFQNSQIVASNLLNDVINNLENDIEQIQMKNMVSSAIHMINSIGSQLYRLQDPQKGFQEPFPLPEQEPCKNITDPISGFNKQNFIKKSSVRQKMSRKVSASLLKDLQGSAVHIPIATSKKLPPLMKQLSEQKLQNQVFIPLEDNIDSLRKKSSLDFEQMVRDRLLKQIENRKFKQKIEAISAGIQKNINNEKRNSKSTYDSGDKSMIKEECNFDYDGNKISISNNGKVKSNLKILKTLYKFPKQKPEQKQTKLQKKFHERISFVPRGSRNYLQINNKSIADYGEINYTAALKQKLQIQLRKTEVKFMEKQYFGKEKERRDSIVS